MKIIINSKELQVKLNKLKKITRGKHSLSILSNVLIDAQDSGRIILQATNLEIGITVDVLGKIVQTGSITVNEKKISDLIKKAKSDIVLTLWENCMLNVDIGKANYDIIALPDDDFPEIKTGLNSDKNIITVNLSQHINDMLYVLKEINGTQYNLNGMLVEVTKDRVNFVVIDGKRMVINHEGIVNGGDEYNFVIPQQVLEIIAGNKEAEDCTITFDGERILIQYNDTIYVSKKLESEFPNWRLFVPKQTVNSFFCNREELIERLELLKPMLPENSNRITFELHGNKLHLSAVNNEYGKGNAEISSDINITTDDDKILGFSQPLLLEMLRHETGETVSFEYNNKLSQVCINGKDRIIMPLRTEEEE